MNNSAEKQVKNAQNNGLFKVRTANECIEDAKLQPKMLKLFGDLWYSNEIAILFAMANVGKSIFGVQIANALSKGANHELQILDIETMAQKVIYVDFELSDLQFLKRYSDLINNTELDTYNFNENFIRVVPNPDYNGFGADYAEKVIKEIENSIIASSAKVLVIDNITALRFEAAETASIAIMIMQSLKTLKSKYNLSILVLAHTPKRPFYKPLDMYDLAGSSFLQNFADSIFAVGVSHKNSDTRYIKQLKTRSEKMMYGEHNVITCDIVKENKFLKFRYLTTDNESSHLNQEKTDVQKEKKDIAKELYDNGKGKSYREIGEILGVSHATVKKWIDGK
jgi:RecA-family ATPase